MAEYHQKAAEFRPVQINRNSVPLSLVCQGGALANRLIEVIVENDAAGVKGDGL
jgi:hypothetical protein